ncbi:MAG: hypothetical protein ACRD8U_22990 [Pyrinomonadaceae bacterium]
MFLTNHDNTRVVSRFGDDNAAISRAFGESVGNDVADIERNAIRLSRR